MDETINTSEEITAGTAWGRILRIIFTYIVFVGLFQCIGMIIIGLPFENPESVNSLSVDQHLFLSVMVFVPMVILVFSFRKTLDKKSIASMGFSVKNLKKDMLLGFLVSLIILVTGIVLILLFSQSKLTFSLFSLRNFILSFLLCVIISLNEELFFRGYILNNLLMSGGKYSALILSSVLFTLFHSLNPNLTFLAFINIFLAGMILGSCYIFTQNLWFAISLHLFWNFLQGPVFGYAISGIKLDSLFSMEASGRSFLTGGEFGFEGSIVCTILVSLTIMSILFYYSEKAATIRYATMSKDTFITEKSDIRNSGSH